MSEFEKGGFSAIETFFGGDTNIKNVHDTTKSSAGHHPKGKRRGVGSTAHSTNTQNDLSKKLLNVGRKRQRSGEEDDDNDNDNERNDENHEDDEEEDAGRTSIASKFSGQATSKADIVTNENNPKKKLGKKERNKQNQEQKEPQEISSKDEHKPNHDANDKLAEGEPSSSKAENAQKKHKRRKIRSKQKNIRKDNREKKPEHLVVGRKHYHGRPLTAETRAKLNLPSPKARTPFVAEPSHGNAGTNDVQGTGLAIDDLLEDTGKQVDNEKPLSSQESKCKKSKKSKYKNLKV